MAEKLKAHKKFLITCKHTTCKVMIFLLDLIHLFFMLIVGFNLLKVTQKVSGLVFEPRV